MFCDSRCSDRPSSPSLTLPDTLLVVLTHIRCSVGSCTPRPPPLRVLHFLCDSYHWTSPTALCDSSPLSLSLFLTLLPVFPLPSSLFSLLTLPSSPPLQDCHLHFVIHVTALPPPLSVIHLLSPSLSSHSLFCLSSSSLSSSSLVTVHRSCSFTCLVIHTRLSPSSRSSLLSDSLYERPLSVVPSLVTQKRFLIPHCSCLIN